MASLNLILRVLILLAAAFAVLFGAVKLITWIVSAPLWILAVAVSATITLFSAYAVVYAIDQRWRTRKANKAREAVMLSNLAEFEEKYETTR